MKTEALESAVPAHQEILANGLVVDFFFRANRYFGDYHRVGVDVRCAIPLQSGIWISSFSPAEAEEIRGRWGETAVFSRSLEKMGVPTASLDAVRDELISGFARTTLPYLAHPDFPRRFVAAELKKKVKVPCLPQLRP